MNFDNKLVKAAILLGAVLVLGLMIHFGINATQTIGITTNRREYYEL